MSLVFMLMQPWLPLSLKLVVPLLSLCGKLSYWPKSALHHASWKKYPSEWYSRAYLMGVGGYQKAEPGGSLDLKLVGLWRTKMLQKPGGEGFRYCPETILNDLTSFPLT